MIRHIRFKESSSYDKPAVPLKRWLISSISLLLLWCLVFLDFESGYSGRSLEGTKTESRALMIQGGFFQKNGTEHEIVCSETSRLSSNAYVDTQGYGSMFTILNKNQSLEILTLDFQTVALFGGTVRVLVFTKKGDYRGFEGNDTVWTKIADVEVPASQATDEAALIPQHSFHPVLMEPNELRSFYLTLSTADLRYSSAVNHVGEVANENGHFQIRAGVGLIEFPFASRSSSIFSPRLFSGTVYYGAIVDCNDLLTTTRVPLQFIVQHDTATSKDDVLKEVNGILRASIIAALGTDPWLGRLRNEKSLEFTNVTSSIAHNADSTKMVECQHQGDGVSCTAIIVAINMIHNNACKEGDLTYRILSKREKITDNLNLGDLKVSYAGAVPIESTIRLEVSGTPQRKRMDDRQQNFFEEIAQEFLQGKLGTDSLRILGVNVTEQTEPASSHRRLSDISRLLQRNQGSALDISTTITGEYRPPPFVDFEAEVDFTLEENSDELTRNLRDRRGEPGWLDETQSQFFANVEGIEVLGPNGTKDNSMLATEEEEGGSSVAWLVPVLVVLFVGIAGFVVYRRRKRRVLTADVEVVSEQQDYLTKTFEKAHGRTEVVTAGYGAPQVKGKPYAQKEYRPKAPRTGSYSSIQRSSPPLSAGHNPYPNRGGRLGSMGTAQYQRDSQRSQGSFRNSPPT